jgi:hypothetical protein
MQFKVNKNIVIMSADREDMVNYQITVTNVISIGNKSMAVCFTIFRISMFHSSAKLEVKNGNLLLFMVRLQEKIRDILGLSSVTAPK